MTETYSLEEAASKLPILNGLEESYKPRRLRELVNEAGTPCLRVGKKMFFYPEHLKEFMDHFECHSKSSKSKRPKTGISEEPSEEQGSISLRERRAKMSRNKKDES